MDDPRVPQDHLQTWQEQRALLLTSFRAVLQDLHRVQEEEVAVRPARHHPAERSAAVDPWLAAMRRESDLLVQLHDIVQDWQDLARRTQAVLDEQRATGDPGG